MKAKDLLESWHVKAIEEGEQLSTLDILVFKVFEDARQRGITYATLKKAAGNSVREYFREILVSNPPKEASRFEQHIHR
jgi:hypothetical protein